MRRFSAAIALVFLVGNPLPAQAHRGSSLDGAWHMVGVDVISPESTYKPRPLDGVIVFAGRHFSEIWISPWEPGARQAGMPTTTEQKSERFDAVYADAGTFEVRDTLLVMHWEQSQRAAGVGRTVTDPFRQRGDSMWVIEGGPWASDNNPKAVHRMLLVRRR